MGVAIQIEFPRAEFAGRGSEACFAVWGTCNAGSKTGGVSGFKLAWEITGHAKGVEEVEILFAYPAGGLVPADFAVFDAGLTGLAFSEKVFAILAEILADPSTIWQKARLLISFFAGNAATV